MKYCIYASDNLFEEKNIITKVKKKIISNDFRNDIEIDFETKNDQNICYVFVKEKSEINRNFTLKALLYF